jgi:hypothetical protein
LDTIQNGGCNIPQALVLAMTMFYGFMNFSIAAAYSAELFDYEFLNLDAIPQLLNIVHEQLVEYSISSLA